ncbi:hypothetical protein [Faecalimonas sp.]
MNKKEDPIEKYSDEELQKEADAIRAIIENQPELQEEEMPERAHISLMKKIKEYEEEQLRKSLPEEDQEALRIGREIRKKRESVKQRRKRIQRLVGMAATFALVVGIGITSVGGKRFFVDIFEKNFGGEEKTYIESGDAKVVGEITEEQALEKIKQILGEEPIRMVYRPQNTQFLNAIVDQEIQEAILCYSVDNKVMSLQIVSRYVESSTGIEISDEFQREYIMSLPKTRVVIKEYKVLDTGEKEYTAQFTYKKSKYFLVAIMNQMEFEKIIKNLHFF